jgi:hypothetical protein
VTQGTLMGRRGAFTPLPGGGGGGGGSNPDLGLDIRNWTTYQPNVAQTLIVPDSGVGTRVMYAGNQTIASAARSQYVTVKCFTQYGTQLDLSRTDGGAQGWGIVGSGSHVSARYILVGFDVIAGTMLWEWLDKVIFVGCRFQWPIDTWLNQYANKNGGNRPAWMSTLNSSVLNAMGNNFTPSPFRLAFTNNLQWHLCRWSHIGDDCVFNNGGILEFYNCDGEDNYHHNNQFINPSSGITAMHNDFCQTRGGGNTKIKTSLLPSHLQLATEKTGSQVLDIGTPGSPILVAGSVDSAATMSDDTDGSRINGSAYIRYVCNAQFIDDSGTYYSQPQYPVSAGSPDTAWEGVSTQPYGVANLTHVETFGMNGSGSAPSGVVLHGGGSASNQRLMQELLDQYTANPNRQSHSCSQLLNSSDNPARPAQLAYPYANIDQYIATQVSLP